MTDLRRQIAVGDFEVGLRDGPAVVAVVERGVVEALTADVSAGVAEGLRLLGVGAVEDVDATMAYAASKLALARAMRRRAPEWAKDGVRLNAVAPGAVATPLLDETLADPQLGPLVRAFPVPAGRFGTPDEIAAAIEFLLGASASFCIGSVLFADGGTDALLALMNLEIWCRVYLDRRSQDDVSCELLEKAA